MSFQSRFPEHYDFVGAEHKVLDLWRVNDAFQTQTRLSRGRPRFVFYDGPPFATGLPHYGHFLAGTVKDIVTRYAIMSGFYVERRFGWDCHGLPIEYEIDKLYGIRSPDDVRKMGIADYNSKCRSIAMKFAGEWETQVERMGRWIDFKNDYKTLYPWYMESVWFVFKQMFEKGLVYKGVKVMPFSTACSTPLSNFEANQNYKDVTDPSIVVRFALVDEPDVHLVAWTTTPWTLPSNMALCVHPDLDYVKIECDSELFIVAESRVSSIFVGAETRVVDRFKGSALKAKRYRPLFEFMENSEYRVICDQYVSDSTGTGVVHQAPFFGEDDFRVCALNGVIDKRSLGQCPVDESGRFVSMVKDFEGIYIKDADPLIIKQLENRGLLLSKSTIRHSYPFCWRSETPLIYKAVPCWFIRVEEIVDKLRANNEKINWIPDTIGEKRFGNWLKQTQDWCVSRNRFWGNPIPIWHNEDMSEVVCVGSIEELSRLTGAEISDIHRENIDGLRIPSRNGGPPLQRTSEVFDCWFESGSMPYAQCHFPFSGEIGFPADFIAEGVDQTRGWFYTLIVIGTALFNQSPFKNVLATGIIQAADGRKMSKRLKNYPDPMEVVEKYGADAVRLYLINSPAVKADFLRFQESGVHDIQKEMFVPWYNSIKYLALKIDSLLKDEKIDFVFDESLLHQTSNIMDRWILSYTQSQIKFINDEMKNYRLYTVVPRLVRFVDILTNCYIRLNRDRLCGRNGARDCLLALNTLFEVQHALVHMMAPFTPFLAESFYQLLIPYLSAEKSASIHFRMIPRVREAFIDTEIEETVAAMMAVIESGRIIRERQVIPLKQPLAKVVVVSEHEHIRDKVVRLSDFVSKELNVREVCVSGDLKLYGVGLKVNPNFKTLGIKARSQMKQIVPLIKSMTEADLKQLHQNSTFQLQNGFVLASDDVQSSYSTESEMPSEYHFQSGITVLLDTALDEELLTEKWARELMNRIQKMRKEASLLPTDPISVYYSFGAQSEFSRFIERSSKFISEWIGKPFVKLESPDQCTQTIIASRDFEIHDGRIWIMITSNQFRYANVYYQPVGENPMSGCVLLDNITSIQSLKQEIAKLFGFYENYDRLEIYTDPGKTKKLNELKLSPAPYNLYVADDLDDDQQRMGSFEPNTISESQPICAVLEVKRTDAKTSKQVLLENPKGYVVDSARAVYERIGAVLGIDENDLDNLVVSWDDRHQQKFTDERLNHLLASTKRTLFAKII